MSLDTRRSPRMRPARIACTIGLAGVIALGGAAPIPTLSPAAAHARDALTVAELKRLQSRGVERGGDVRRGDREGR